jgi:hypothetical protein
MNQKKAKALRRLAREEMVGDPARDIVAAPRTNRSGVNSPNSVRGMYRALKNAVAKQKT